MATTKDCVECAKYFVDTQGVEVCPTCLRILLHCFRCNGYRPCVRLKVAPQLHMCTACASFVDGKHSRKSMLYERAPYAIKFVNDRQLSYPDYFRLEFPIGELVEDLGVYVNDFKYAEYNMPYFGLPTTDPGTSRAYKVISTTELGEFECVVVTHESGLEIFILAAAAFLGIETAKFAVKELLSLLQRKINNWWKRYAERMAFPDETLTTIIQVRTPNWEISLDGRFTPEERERLVDRILSIATPAETINELVLSIDDQELALRLRGAARKIVRNESRAPDPVQRGEM